MQYCVLQELGFWLLFFYAHLHCSCSLTWKSVVLNPRALVSVTSRKWVGCQKEGKSTSQCFWATSTMHGRPVPSFPLEKKRKQLFSGVKVNIRVKVGSLLTSTLKYIKNAGVSYFLLKFTATIGCSECSSCSNWLLPEGGIVLGW